MNIYSLYKTNKDAEPNNPTYCEHNGQIILYGLDNNLKWDTVISPKFIEPDEWLELQKERIKQAKLMELI